MGPRFLVRAAGLEMHPIDQADRREYLKDSGGIGYCNITKCCTEVCPEHIKITDNAIIPLKERVADEYYDPIQWFLAQAPRQRRGQSGRRVELPVLQGGPGPPNRRRRRTIRSGRHRAPVERPALPELRRAGGRRSERRRGLRHPDRRRGPRQPRTGVARGGAVRPRPRRTPAMTGRAPDASISDYLGVQTNNVAEYTGVVRALELARELGAREVHLLLDSKLIVEQLAGRWRVKDAKLIPLWAAAAPDARRASSGGPRRTCPRAQNTVADALANEAIDRAQAGGPASVVRRPGG